MGLIIASSRMIEPQGACEPAGRRNGRWDGSGSMSDRSIWPMDSSDLWQRLAVTSPAKINRRLISLRSSSRCREFRRASHPSMMALSRSRGASHPEYRRSNSTPKACGTSRDRGQTATECPRGPSACTRGRAATLPPSIGSNRRASSNRERSRSLRTDRGTGCAYQGHCVVGRHIHGASKPRRAP